MVTRISQGCSHYLLVLLILQHRPGNMQETHVTEDSPTTDKAWLNSSSTRGGTTITPKMTALTLTMYTSNITSEMESSYPTRGGANTTSPNTTPQTLLIGNITAETGSLHPTRGSVNISANTMIQTPTMPIGNYTVGMASSYPTRGDATSSYSIRGDSTSLYPTREDSTSLYPTREDSTSLYPTREDSTSLYPTSKDSTSPYPTREDSTSPHPTREDSTSLYPTREDSTSLYPTREDSTSPHPTREDSTSLYPTSKDSTSPYPTSEDSTSPHPTREDSTSLYPTREDSTSLYPTREDSTSLYPTSKDSTSPYPTREDSTSPHPTREDSTSLYPTREDSTSLYPTSEDSTSLYPTSKDSTSPHPTSEDSTSPYPTSEDSTSPHPTREDSTSPYPTRVDSTSPYPTSEDLTSPYPTRENSTSLYPTREDWTSLYPTREDSTSLYPTREESTITTNTTLQTLTVPVSNTTAGMPSSYPTEEDHTTFTPKASVETGTVSMGNITAEVESSYSTRGSETIIPNSTIQTVTMPMDNITTTAQSLYSTQEVSTGTPVTHLGTEGASSYGTSTVPIGPHTSNTTRGQTAAINSTTLHSGWAASTGTLSCHQDDNCPPFSSCILQGCLCDLGLYFHQDMGCVTARTFPAQISASVLGGALRSEDETRPGGTIRTWRDADISQEVAVLFRGVLGHLPGYLSTSLSPVQPSDGQVTIVHSFSMLHPLTEKTLWEELKHSALLCDEGSDSCVSLLTADTYHSLSLCEFAMCEPASSNCQSQSGLVTCECRQGYYKFNPSDRSCRACDSGFRWAGMECLRCSLGFGGFNCEEPFLLAVIVESCVGSLLLVSQVTLLFYYLRRKKKKKPKPTFMDSLILGVPTDQPALRLPRAQFSWRREWEWMEPAGQNLQNVHQGATKLEQLPKPPDIPMTTFGNISRSSVASSGIGSHNLAFVSDD
ncbi:protein HEG-like isoform X2 [Hyperolius riggenbachi]|uniref:protein HEG-like isoform X2 n=1 Tax=Hyperolius riggenbachi TaxID=752182 RepID=UPI0035A32738